MNRRDLLRRIGIALPAVALSPVVSAMVAAKTTAPEPGTGDIFHGWRMYWTGWKDLPNADILASQWIAYSPDIKGYHLYSSWPGGCGTFVSGAIFDLSWRDWQAIPKRSTGPEELERMKSECRERLKRMIVRVGPPPVEYYDAQIRIGDMK
jgi:hypothetical protein